MGRPLQSRINDGETVAMSMEGVKEGRDLLTDSLRMVVNENNVSLCKTFSTFAKRMGKSENISQG